MSPIHVATRRLTVNSRHVVHTQETVHSADDGYAAGRHEVEKKKGIAYSAPLFNGLTPVNNWLRGLPVLLAPTNSMLSVLRIQWTLSRRPITSRADCLEETKNDPELAGSF